MVLLQIVPLVTESELQAARKRLKPVSQPTFDEFLSLRGPGGVVGGFGGQAPSQDGQYWGGTHGQRLAESVSDVQSNKVSVPFKDTAKGDDRPSSRVEARRLAARVGTPAVDRIQAVGAAAGAGVYDGVSVSTSVCACTCLPGWL